NKRKNNRIDAEILARLVRADPKLLYPIQHRDDKSRSGLAVIRSRDVLVKCRTKLINHVRGVSKSFGTNLPQCSAESFVTRCSAEVPAVLHEAVNLLFHQISEQTAQIKIFDRQIAALIKQQPAAQQLMQITGVGPLTALAYVLTIEDPRRIV